MTINPPISYAQYLSLPVISGIFGVGAVVVAKARKKESRTARLLQVTKRMLPSALGIEILCVASAEIGGLIALYSYGFNPIRIIMAYTMAYAFAGFTTFASILGRSTGQPDDIISCGCNDLHENRTTARELGSAIKNTFVNFKRGIW
jgi:hypothetical protein